MEKNSFQQLEQVMESRYQEAHTSIKANVKGRKNFWTIVGDLFELYIPRIVATLVGTSSSDSKRTNRED